MGSTEPEETPHSLTIHLFGPFEARLDGESLPRLRTRKGEWLLALLVLRHGAEVERTWLAGTLWPDSSEPAALANLRNSLTDLRQALGGEADRLRAPTTRTLSWDPRGAEIDVVTFDAAIANGDLPALEEAVSLYRGPLLEGSVEAWVLEERAAREQSYLTALERNLRRALATDPLRESTHRALMEVQAASGSTAAALLSYRELRLLLHRELNAEPDAATRALFEQIRAAARSKAALGSGLWALGHGPQSSGARAVAVSAQSPEPRAQSGSEATLTFLFTDIEGSTRLWEEAPAGMEGALARHDALIRETIVTHGGQIFKSWGDQFCATFGSAPEAAAAALAIQRALSGLLIDDCRLMIEGTVPSPDQQSAISNQQSLKVRIALHTGTVAEREGDYIGPPLNRAARLLDAGHGGQTLLSLATAELVRDHLPEGASLRDLGDRRLRDLVRPERIFQLVAPDLPADFPRLRTLEVYPHNLPIQLTSFIGREEEIAEVQRLLDQHRLVTLHGAGGCGKTRLALQVAGDRVGALAHGVWLVELASLANPSLVTQVVATALGIGEQPDRPLLSTLIEVLKEQELLLLMDNCEHLVGTCAEVAEALLRACPGVRILATSREALGIAGEARYRVPSLAVPERSAPVSWERLTQYAAVRLFIDRAVSVRPEFAITNENAPAVAQICHRLDGIPLAIELAAARVTALPVEKINERLDDRFRLLTGAYSRTALPRQQTLRALIDWSYDLLSEPERMLLRRLSVFAGGWTLEAAEAVCSGLLIADCRLMIEETPDPSPISNRQSAISNPEDVLDLLIHLVGKSLVSYEEAPLSASGARPVPGGEGSRYRLLETMRQYGRDRLREAGEVEAVKKRHRDWYLGLVERAAPELSGGRQAEWRERLDAEHDNLRAALEWSVDRGEAPEALRLAGGLLAFWTVRGYATEGRQRLDAVLALEGAQGHTAARARALAGAAFLAWRQGDYTAARRRLEESLGIARALGEGRIISDALAPLAQIAYALSDYETACSLTEERLAISRQLGDRQRIAMSLTGLAIWVKFQGDLTRAWALCEESLAISREGADTWAIARKTLHELGSVAVCQGDFARAQPFLEESLALHRKAGDRIDVAWSLHHLGDAAFYQGEYPRARALYEESLALRREVGDRLGMGFSLCRLADVALAEGDVVGAFTLLGECVAIRRWLGNRRGLAECLEGFARIGRAREQWERAARQLGTAEALRETIKAPLWPCERREYEGLVAALRAALGEEALVAAWAEGRSIPLDQALDDALQEAAGV